MGDIPVSTDGGFQPLEPLRAGLTQSETNPTPGIHDSARVANNRSPRSNTPFYSQYSSIPQTQQHLDTLRSPAQQPQSSYSLPLGHGQGPSFSMGAMAGALPEYQGPPSQLFQHHQQSTQRRLSGASTPALVYQLQQISQYPGQTTGGLPNQRPINPAYNQGQYQSSYLQQGAQPGIFSYGQTSPHTTGMSAMQQSYHSFQQQPPPQYVYYSTVYGPQGTYGQPFSIQPAPQISGYNRQSSLPSSQVSLPNADPSILGGNFPPSRITQGIGDNGASGHIEGMSSSQVQLVPRAGSESSLSTLPRGPPRKPKQSGHALWVGNLPSGTTVIDLKDHFSREASKDIESLFLISKSNCAFVNYRTEASCTAAMHRFHDSRFNGVRLVCRLRRSLAPSPGVPAGPSAMSPRASSASPPQSPQRTEREESPTKVERTTQQLPGGEPRSDLKVPEKFFIVKSLTLQDLELSVRNGIWATQAHNEETLNKAYQSAENVYLIFSANKSGEYFGYARMASPISDDPTEVISMAPKTDKVGPADGPRSIPTPATEWAPKGRIIDDSARGTIFWEAEHSDEDEDNHSEEGQSPAGDDTTPSAQTWGKPFKVEWMSTNRLPFYRTRGLRNPWNANREVKIARDGTELETSVGERLVQMFHRLGPSNVGMPGPSIAAPQQQTQGIGMNLPSQLQRQPYS